MRRDPDVLIIGGGVIGLCTAYYLCRDGRSVTLVDRSLVGGPQACSYGNAGYIGPSGTVPLPEPGIIREGLRALLNPASPFSLRPRLNLGLLAWLYRFTRACTAAQAMAGHRVLSELKRNSLELFKELQARGELKFGLAQSGKLVLFATTAGLARGRAAAELFRMSGGHASVLTSAEVRAMCAEASPDVVGGIHYQEDSYIDPAAFLAAMTRLVERSGGEIVSFAEPLDFEVTADRITAVKTTRGDFCPHEVVIAAGAWSAPLARRLGVRLLVEAGRGYSITVRRPHNGPTVPVMLGEARVALTPLGETLRLSGVMELAGCELAISRRRLDGIVKSVEAYLPNLEHTETVQIWNGLRPCTPDGVPLIGRCPRYRNLMIACGHGMIGMGLAPVTGSLVAQILGQDRADINLIPLRVDRF